MAHSHFALSIETIPSNEPISTAEAKAHLRVDISDDDTLIDRLVKAARQRLEADTGQVLITQVWNMYLDCFPSSNYQPIKVLNPPLVSIDSITYVDGNGDVQTWDSSEYRVDTKSMPARITPASGYSWPSISNVTNAITIQFTAGYGDDGSDVLEDLRQAMLMLIGHWYENRESVVIGTITAPVPQAYEWLISNHVFKEVC